MSWLRFTTLAVLAMMLTVPAHAAERPRLASINACTDQLLLAIADPEQIVGISRYSRELLDAWGVPDVARYPVLSGNAEDVLVAGADIVLADAFTRRATRDLLAAKNRRVETFAVVTTIAEARAQMLRMGAIAGHPVRAAAHVARLDAALARTRTLTAQTRLRVLPVSRRGWVTGQQSILGSLLAETGLANAAGELGFASGGFAPLETIVMLKPDLLLVADTGATAADQGQAFLRHPALGALYPPAKRIVLADGLTVCGGPSLIVALERLTAEVERVALRK